MSKPIDISNYNYFRLQPPELMAIDIISFSWCDDSCTLIGSCKINLKEK